MKKIYLILLIFMFILQAAAWAQIKPLTDSECAEIIKTYKIDPKIKSVRGWKNVFSSDKWLKRFNLDGYNQAELDCIMTYILANAMDVKEYNQFIGMELKL